MLPSTLDTVHSYQNQEYVHQDFLRLQLCRNFLSMDLTNFLNSNICWMDIVQFLYDDYDQLWIPSLQCESGVGVDTEADKCC